MTRFRPRRDITAMFGRSGAVLQGEVFTAAASRLAIACGTEARAFRAGTAAAAAAASTTARALLAIRAGRALVRAAARIHGCRRGGGVVVACGLFRGTRLLLTPRLLLAARALWLSGL